MKNATLVIATVTALTFMSGPSLADAELNATASADRKIQYLLDREEIGQMIIDYGLAFDMQDWQ